MNQNNGNGLLGVTTGVMPAVGDIFGFSSHNLVLLCLKGFLIFILTYFMFLQKELGVLILIGFLLYVFIPKHKRIEELIVLTLIISTNFFEFSSVNDAPYVQIGPGLRFNALDILIITSSLFALFSFRRKKITLASKQLIGFLFLSATIYLLINLTIEPSPRDAGANYYRILTYPIFYFALVYYFRENPGNVGRLLIILGAFVIVSAITQYIEISTGLRLLLPGVTPSNEYYSESGMQIFSAGQRRMYVWTRVSNLLLFVVPFSFAALVSGLKRHRLFILMVFLAGIVSIYLATVRIWIAIYALSIFIILFLSRSKMMGRGRFILILGLIIASFGVLNDAISQASGIDLLESFVGRTQSIFTLGATAGEQDTFSERVFMFQRIFNKVSESPFWGYGFGEYIINNFSTNDLGIINRFLFFGMIGTLPVLVLFIRYIVNLLTQVKRQLDPSSHVVLIAAAGMFIAHLLGYLFQQDIWGSPAVISMLMVNAAADAVTEQGPIEKANPVPGVQVSTPLVQNLHGATRATS